MSAWLECVACQRRYDMGQVRYTCDCQGLLSLERDQDWWRRIDRDRFDRRRAGRDPLDQSGVWRFREAVVEVDPSEVVSHPEGGTHLYSRPALSRDAGLEHLWFKHEGENPTGSFKDRGMTVAMTQAVRLGARAVACASTGNTSASLAAYAAQAGLRGLVFIPAGKVALGKMAQTLAYGATCLEVRGDFDAAMELVADVARQLDIYLVNSINPFRIEGQKTIVWELLQDLGWNAPDWIVVPAGNLGNTSAFGKALREAHEAGWIDRLPRLLAVQASGANPFFLSYGQRFERRFQVQAETVATAIRIGNPVSYDKARAAILSTGGIVTQVTDAELLAAKGQIDGAGIGCEPASAVTYAAVKNLRRDGTIEPDARVVCVLTGNLLKDPDAILRDESRTARQIIPIEPTIEAVRKALG
jgi:threonine synthase